MLRGTPANFSPGIDPVPDARDARNGEPRGRCFAFTAADLLVLEHADTIDIPTWEDFRAWDLAIVRYQYLGALDGEPCWSIELPAELAPPAGTKLTGLRALYDTLPEAFYGIAGRAIQIIAWERDHQFCSRCGTPTEPMPGERARRCPSCGLTAYPRVTPAVITLIERGDRILLARGHAFAPARFGIIAGFVEPGETLEDAVRREAMEEAGIELDRVEYFASQPWPFPHGIMIGFRAHHLRGEITLDDGELAEADWYDIDSLPQIPAKLSIARALIDDWATRRGAVIDQP